MMIIDIFLSVMTFPLYVALIYNLLPPAYVVVNHSLKKKSKFSIIILPIYMCMYVLNHVLKMSQSQRQ